MAANLEVLKNFQIVIVNAQVHFGRAERSLRVRRETRLKTT